VAVIVLYRHSKMS